MQRFKEFAWWLSLLATLIFLGSRLAELLTSVLHLMT